MRHVSHGVRGRHNGWRARSYATIALLLIGAQAMVTSLIDSLR